MTALAGCAAIPLAVGNAAAANTPLERFNMLRRVRVRLRLRIAWLGRRSSSMAVLLFVITARRSARHGAIVLRAVVLRFVNQEPVPAQYARRRARDRAKLIYPRCQAPGTR